MTALRVRAFVLSTLIWFGGYLAAVLLVLGLLLLLAGCTSISGMGGGVAAVAREIGKDPASVCAFVGTPYGPVLIARANQSGARVVVANGTCTIERAVE